MTRTVQREKADTAITRGEALVLLGLVLLSVYLVMTLGVQGGRGAEPPVGVMSSALGSMGRTLVLGGEAFVFSRDTKTADTVPLVVPAGASPSTAGPVMLMGVQLPVGYLSAIPMSTCTMTMSTRQAGEVLHYTTERPVPLSGWGIARQKNLPPFSRADEDMLLEPQERFDLVINPSLSLRPGEQFSVTLLPDKGFPLVVSGAVPVRVNPVNRFAGT